MKIRRDYVELGNLVDSIIDNRGKTVPTTESGIPLIATNCIKHSSIYPTLENLRYISKDIYNHWFRAHLKPNDILFVNKGTPGGCCIVPSPVNFVVAQDMVGLRFKEEFDPFYMLAVLRSSEIQRVIQNNYVGLVIPHFRKQELVKLKLPIHKKQIRDQIGHIYCDISHKIELNNKINAELEALAKLIYDYWFVQFDFPDGNGKLYKSSGGKMVWSEELKREIPEGWEVKKIGDVLSCLESGRRDKGGSVSSGIPSIGAESIAGLGEYDFSNEKFISKELFTSLKSGKLQSKDVVLYKDGAYIGKNTIFMDGFPYEECAVNEHVFILRTNKKLPSQYYLYLWLQIPEIMLFMQRVGLRAAQPGLNQSDINNVPIQIPNDKLLEDFNEYIAPIISMIFKNAKESKKLAALRDWLLPMLMNGQVRVSE